MTSESAPRNFEGFLQIFFDDLILYYPKEFVQNIYMSTIESSITNFYEDSLKNSSKDSFWLIRKYRIFNIFNDTKRVFNVHLEEEGGDLSSNITNKQRQI